MSLKDEHLIKDVFMMNMTFILSIVLVIGMALIFFVFAKGNYEKQAKEIVTKAQEDIKYQKSQINDNVMNNNLLWTLIDSTWRSPDKSIAFVKKLASAQKLPRCNGKECTGTEDESRLNTIQANDNSSIKVGWGSKKGRIKYSYMVIYDNKNKFVTIDASDLLGKSIENTAEGESAEEESSEE